MFFSSAHRPRITAPASSSDLSTPCDRRVASTSLDDSSGDTGKNFGCTFIGTPRYSDQRASSTRR